jgi:hypothetical protein
MVFWDVFSHDATVPSEPGSRLCWELTITLRHTTVGRTPLDEWSARRTDLYYLTTQNTHNRQTSMPSAGFEPIIPESERPKTYALERAATGIGLLLQPIGTNVSAENGASIFTLKGLSHTECDGSRFPHKLVHFYRTTQHYTPKSNALTMSDITE